jgi:steroid delta-isomerase-like uncharacterized protein
MMNKKERYPMSVEANKALVRRIFDEMNRGNPAIIEEVYDPDYMHHDPSLPPAWQRGRDNYLTGMRTFFTAFPDLHGTVEEVVAEGDKVVVRITWRGTQKGELMGIPPSGKRAEFGFIGTMRIADGNVAEGWVNFDSMGMLQQLGAIPASGQA